MLEPHEAVDLELEHECEVCATHNVSYVSLPIADRSVPAADDAAQKFIDLLYSELHRGRKVNVHCRQGIGRSGLIAASLLIESGMRPEHAIWRVSAARGVPIPETAEQREWIDYFATALAERQ